MTFDLNRLAFVTSSETDAKQNADIPKEVNFTFKCLAQYVGQQLQIPAKMSKEAFEKLYQAFHDTYYSTQGPYSEALQQKFRTDIAKLNPRETEMVLTKVFRHLLQKEGKLATFKEDPIQNMIYFMGSLGIKLEHWGYVDSANGSRQIVQLPVDDSLTIPDLPQNAPVLKLFASRHKLPAKDGKSADSNFYWEPHGFEYDWFGSDEEARERTRKHLAAQNQYFRREQDKFERIKVEAAARGSVVEEAKHALETKQVSEEAKRASEASRAAEASRGAEVKRASDVSDRTSHSRHVRFSDGRHPGDSERSSERSGERSSEREHEFSAARPGLGLGVGDPAANVGNVTSASPFVSQSTSPSLSASPLEAITGFFKSFAGGNLEDEKGKLTLKGVMVMLFAGIAQICSMFGNFMKEADTKYKENNPGRPLEPSEIKDRQDELFSNYVGKLGTSQDHVRERLTSHWRAAKTSADKIQEMEALKSALLEAGNVEAFDKLRFDQYSAKIKNPATRDYLKRQKMTKTLNWNLLLKNLFQEGAYSEADEILQEKALYQLQKMSENPEYQNCDIVQAYHEAFDALNEDAIDLATKPKADQIRHCLKREGLSMYTAQVEQGLKNCNQALQKAQKTKKELEDGLAAESKRRQDRLAAIPADAPEGGKAQKEQIEAEYKAKKETADKAIAEQQTNLERFAVAKENYKDKIVQKLRGDLNAFIPPSKTSDSSVSEERKRREDDSSRRDDDSLRTPRTETRSAVVSPRSEHHTSARVTDEPRSPRSVQTPNSRPIVLSERGRRAAAATIAALADSARSETRPETRPVTNSEVSETADQTADRDLGLGGMATNRARIVT